MCSPHTLQILTVRAPSGVLVIRVTQGLSQYPAACMGEDDLGLPCPLLWRLLPAGHGTSGEFGRGWARRRMSSLGGQEAKKLDRKWAWGTEVYLGYLRLGLLTRRLKEGPRCQFPSFPEQVQGLAEGPWPVGPVVVCHPFKCSHFQVTILSLALPWAEHVWHTSLTFMP